MSQVAHHGLKKNLNSSLPLGQAALKFCSPWVYFFSYLVGNMPGPLPNGQVRMKSYLPVRKVYL